MCLPFICGGRDDHRPAGRHHGSPPPQTHGGRPSDGDRPVLSPVKHASPEPAHYPVKNLGGGRMNGPAHHHPGGGDMNGERTAPPVSNYSADADVPSGGLPRGRKGPAEKAAPLSPDTFSRKAPYVPAGAGGALPQYSQPVGAG